ncbi:hypothetical protein ZIOFF_065515 [Zingiber officinale]|uniref:ADP-ribosylation factor GTPase-activating protein AGD12 n=1 Tax=Zingiber officinale TaxID=94328 RepID=A0A8J5EX75_ZINOF|nr:hypothetical protein ZIOFF_065515 [Zingiber officinale]
MVSCSISFPIQDRKSARKPSIWTRRNRWDKNPTEARQNYQKKPETEDRSENIAIHPYWWSSRIHRSLRFQESDEGVRTFKQRCERRSVVAAKRSGDAGVDWSVEKDGDRRRNWKKLRDLSMKSDNRICADCSGSDPKWVSANIGVFLCLKCSDIHRSLGANTSKVLSLTLDEWSESDMESVLEVGGNSYANSIYEAFLPRDYLKPKPDASNEDRTKFIRSKYVLQEFLTPSLRIVSSKSSFQSVDSSKSSSSFGSKNSNKNVEAGEFIGNLKVTVVRGTNLAIRDMLTSDPYVILMLGQQKAQTTVKNSDLNPVWNEELKFSIPQHFGTLKLQVYDHDYISADDIMGEAEIDLQAMITAALAYGHVDVQGKMQVGKWLKMNDNALIEDSFVNVVDGKIKQEVHLKLQNVECGEMELQLEWLSMDK